MVLGSNRKHSVLKELNKENMLTRKHNTVK